MLTELIALAIGAYAVAAGIGLLVDPGKARALFDRLRDDAALTFISGVFIYFLGVVVLLAHWQWDGWLEIIVTLIGIGVVIEGLAFLIAPGGYLAPFRRLWLNSPSRLWAGLSIACGLFLLLAGGLRLA